MLLDLKRVFAIMKWDTVTMSVDIDINYFSGLV